MAIPSSFAVHYLSLQYEILAGLVEGVPRSSARTWFFSEEDAGPLRFSLVCRAAGVGQAWARFHATKLLRYIRQETRAFEISKRSYDPQRDPLCVGSEPWLCRFGVAGLPAVAL
jgi:hypothetical protein